MSGWLQAEVISNRSTCSYLPCVPELTKKPSQQAQDSLKGIIEEYSAHARFILTCNNPNRVQQPIKSRCNTMHFNSIDQTEFTARVATILVEEQIQFDLDTLDSYVKATYPDLRKCLNILQSNSKTGTLNKPSENDKSVRDWRLDAVDLFKNGNIRKGREVICAQANVEDINAMFRWFYDNLGLWSKTPEGQDEAILAIRKGMVNHSMVADPEINLSATLVELTQIEQ